MRWTVVVVVVRSGGVRVEAEEGIPALSYSGSGIDEYSKY